MICAELSSSYTLESKKLRGAQSLLKTSENLRIFTYFFGAEIICQVLFGTPCICRWCTFGFEEKYAINWVMLTKTLPFWTSGSEPRSAWKPTRKSGKYLLIGRNVKKSGLQIIYNGCFRATRQMYKCISIYKNPEATSYVNDTFSRFHKCSQRSDFRTLAAVYITNARTIPTLSNCTLQSNRKQERSNQKMNTVLILHIIF